MTRADETPRKKGKRQKAKVHSPVGLPLPAFDARAASRRKNQGSPPSYTAQRLVCGAALSLKAGRRGVVAAARGVDALTRSHDDADDA